MINWIKFSERQPEKEGEYLFCVNPLSCIVFYEKWPSILNFQPDYWAEINLPPKETPMSEKLLCKDCKWIATGLSPDPMYPKCDNPEAPHSLVTGAANHRCESLRGNLSGPRYREEMTAEERKRFSKVEPCGPEGKWFEGEGRGDSSARISDYAGLLKKVAEITSFLADSANHYRILLTCEEIFVFIKTMAKIQKWALEGMNQPT